MRWRNSTTCTTRQHKWCAGHDRPWITQFNPRLQALWTDGTVICIFFRPYTAVFGAGSFVRASALYLSVSQASISSRNLLWMNSEVSCSSLVISSQIWSRQSAGQETWLLNTNEWLVTGRPRSGVNCCKFVTSQRQTVPDTALANLYSKPKSTNQLSDIAYASTRPMRAAIFKEQWETLNQSIW